MSFARFMAGPIGRGVRVVAGIALIVIGIVVGSVGGVILAVVGAVALLAGAANFCLISPLLKAPFKGKDALAQPKS